MGDRSGGADQLLRRCGVVAADARDRRGASEACRSLLVVLILGLYPLVADYFPGFLMAFPITFETH